LAGQLALGQAEVEPCKRLFWRLATLVPDLASEPEAMANAASHLEQLAKGQGVLSQDTNFAD
jgi:hypothetical protein